MRRLDVTKLTELLRAAFPFALTAFVTLILASVILPLVRPEPAPTFSISLVPIVVPTSVPATVETRTPTTQPVPAPEATPPPATATIVIFPTDTISFELTRLQTDLNTSNGFLLLLKAASRLQAARLALRDNDFAQIESQLAVAQEDLAQAGQLLPEPLKGTVQVLMSDINYLLDDLTVRPEEVDERLFELWERITAAVDLQIR